MSNAGWGCEVNKNLEAVSLNKLKFEEIKGKFAKYGEELQTKTSKKQKIDNKDVSALGEKVAEVKEEEQVKRTGKRKKQMARKGINVDKSAQEDSETDKEESVEAMNPTLLTIKSDSVANWKIFQQGQRSVYQIIRANGTDTVYMSFGAMLKTSTERIRRIGNWSNAFSCEVLALIRRISFVGYSVLWDSEVQYDTTTDMSAYYSKTTFTSSEQVEDEPLEVLKVQKSIHPLSGSPTPSSDSSVVSPSPSLTPLGNSDFLLEEIDAFPSLDLIPLGIDDEIFDAEGDILLLEKLLNIDSIRDLPPQELNCYEFCITDLILLVL
ncbi:hypothetical protein Tco_0880302 [Tanacetum coccineum]